MTAFFPITNALTGLAPSAPRWIYVRPRFNALIESIGINPAFDERCRSSIESVTACLNRTYWGHGDKTQNCVVGGSWGKGTRVLPTRDIDLLFVLPTWMAIQFEGRSGNKQSQLLQHVKNTLGATFSRTDLRGDGQVVQIRFDHIVIEVVPLLAAVGGGYVHCDTHEGGWYKHCDPWAEINELNAADQAALGSVKHLARLGKLWARHVDAPIEGFHLERFAIEFMKGWSYTRGDTYWYDWMVRDFFAFMTGYGNGVINMPGTGIRIPLGDAWVAKAQKAAASAVTACMWEDLCMDQFAADAWGEIFGHRAKAVTA